MSINFKRLDHIQLCIPTGKENEARLFYTDILGLKEIPKPEVLISNGGLWYEMNDIQLHIGTEDFTENSKRHPAFEIEDLDEVINYLRSKNVKVKEDIPIPNINRVSIFDPFGNRIELLEKF